MSLKIRALWAGAIVVAILLPSYFLDSRRSPEPKGEVSMEIREEADRPGRIEVELRAEGGWEAPADFDWSTVLVVENFEAGAEEPESPVAGRYEVDGDELTFKPGFSLMEGARYRLRFDPAALPGGGERMEAVTRFYAFKRPRVIVDRSPPVLKELHPSVPVLPANHLKFYLLFSEPMQRGRVFEFLKLIRDDGEEVLEPFRDTELWAEEGRRFTLWFHPGRQKDGVNLNVDFGPILEEGRGYRLVVSGEWKAESGLALGEAIEYRFKAGPQDREKIDVNAWRIEAPKAGTRERVRLFFPEPLDWALLRSRVGVQSAEGLEIAGKIEMGVQELAWFFLPERIWKAGSYRIEVGTILEDLAGNSVVRLFEVDVGGYGDGGGEDVPPDVVYLPFVVE